MSRVGFKFNIPHKHSFKRVSYMMSSPLPPHHRDRGSWQPPLEIYGTVHDDAEHVTCRVVVEQEITRQGCNLQGLTIVTSTTQKYDSQHT